MQDGDHGRDREIEARQIAARLGVADFVYSAPQNRKGSALREPSGDGLLIVGGRGAILQVKARAPDQAKGDSVERAEQWARKNAKKALAQGLGTKRELARLNEAGTPMVVWPVRALYLADVERNRYACLVTYDTCDWPVIVILEHPNLREVDLGLKSGVVWFTFEDWSALHRRLRSTAATINYVHRILKDKCHVPLGYEAARYAALQAEDERAAGNHPGSFPYLAHPEAFDELGIEIYHDVIDKVWPDDGVIPWRNAEEYRRIVEFLDTVPPVAQALTGRWFLRKRAEIVNGATRSTGLIRLSTEDRLVFACSNLEHWTGDDEWQAEVSALTTVRHAQAIETGAPDATVTLGIGVLVENRNGKEGVSYLFLLLIGRDGRLEMPTDLRRLFEWRYGVHNHRNGTTKELSVSNDEICPCLSGAVFAECCGKPKGF